jgi:hypothetical protein
MGRLCLQHTPTLAVALFVRGIDTLAPVRVQRHLETITAFAAFSVSPHHGRRAAARIGRNLLPAASEYNETTV